MKTVDPSATVHKRLLSGEYDKHDKLLPSIGSVIQGEELLIDLRFVDPKDDHLIVTALSPASAPQTASADVEFGSGTAEVEGSAEDGQPS